MVQLLSELRDAIETCLSCALVVAARRQGAVL